MKENTNNLLGSIGLGICLWMIAAVYPAWVIMLSIVDTFFNWVGPDGEVNEAVYSSAFVTGCILFLVLSGICGWLTLNIRKTWGIVLPLYAICFYPFICWVEWLILDKILRESSKLFPGVDWCWWF